MGWLETLRGRVVGLDTAPLVYFIERHEDYIEILRPFFVSLSEGQFQVVTSNITLLEVLVQPLRKGDEATAHRYNDILLSSPNLLTVPITHIIAQEAAELRARHNLRTADAIQLAAAINHGASHFLTNDDGIPNDCGIDILRLKKLTAG